MDKQLLFRNRLFSAALSLGAAALLLLLCRSVYGGTGPFAGVGFKQLLAVCLVTVAAFLLREPDVKCQPNYIQRILGLGPAGDPAKPIRRGNGQNPVPRSDGQAPAQAGLPPPARDARYDWLRVLAVLFVITVHTLDGTLPFISAPLEGPMLDAYNRTPWAVSYAAAAARAFLIQGNSLFVMLSGALLLPWREESIGRFYARRLTKVALPLVVYFFFYMWVNRHLTPFSADAFLHCLHRLAAGDFSADCPFMWLAVVLVVFYLTVPFFRYLFRDIPYRALTAFAAVIFLTMVINIYSPLDKFYTPFTASWTGMAILGYWVTRPETRRFDLPLMLLGASGFALLLLITDPAAFATGYLDKLVHCSPIGMLISLGLFAVVFHFEAFFRKPRLLLTCLSGQSYTVLLLHWWALDSVVKSSLGVSGAWYNPLSFAASIGLTAVIALIAGILLDNTLVLLARTLLDLPLTRLMRE